MNDITKRALEIVRGYDGPKIRIMEVCGTHTHEIFRLGIRKILPENIELIAGPGCPVCVTPVSYIDEAIYLALEKGCMICTFGDLVRVPGSKSSLARARAEGADVRIVYSPQDALRLAEEDPEKEVVFLSVGFETTVPGECMAVLEAEEKGITNFSLLVANKTMPNAYEALKDSADAFLYPGHVSVITGERDGKKLLEEGISGVIAGFTAEELLLALAVIVTRAKQGKPFFENCYPRVVRPEGNPSAMAVIDQVMEACDTEWRGLGMIPESGLKLREAYASYDARKKFEIPSMDGKGNPACRCGEVLRGEIRPTDCPLFGKICTPEDPVGACMVSSEGNCAAYYQYGEWN